MVEFPLASSWVLLLIVRDHFGLESSIGVITTIASGTFIWSRGYKRIAIVLIASDLVGERVLP